MVIKKLKKFNVYLSINLVVLHIMTNRLCNILNICHVMLFLCNLQREDKLNHTTSPSTSHAGPRVAANHALITTDLVQ